MADKRSRPNGDMTLEQIDWDFKITDYSVLENVGKGTKQIKRQKQQQKLLHRSGRIKRTKSTLYKLKKKQNNI